MDDDLDRFYEGLDLYLRCGAGMPVDPRTGVSGCGHTQGQHEFGAPDPGPARCEECPCEDFR